METEANGRSVSLGVLAGLLWVSWCHSLLHAHQRVPIGSPRLINAAFASCRVLSQRFKGHTNEVEPWYGTEYSTELFPDKLLKVSRVSCDALLCLLLVLSLLCIFVVLCAFRLGLWPSFPPAFRCFSVLLLLANQWLVSRPPVRCFLKSVRYIFHQVFKTLSSRVIWCFLSRR